MKTNLIFGAIALSLSAKLAVLEAAFAEPSQSTIPIAQSVAEDKKQKSPEQPKLDRFESDIRAYESEDSKKPPEPGCTVFVGSSTFRIWTSIENDFREFKAINRGFGGSTFPDVNHYVDRIVTKYKPARVVVYAGTNDIADLHHSGEDIFHDFEEFVRKVQAKSPSAEIYFISMSMAPSRVQWASIYEAGNSLIRKYCSQNKHLHYIDVVPVMRDAKGQLRRELFGLDQLHMNKDGYALWKPVVIEALRKPL
jgi:lysophospholipase L1-like esterase